MQLQSSAQRRTCLRRVWITRIAIGCHQSFFHQPGQTQVTSFLISSATEDTQQKVHHHLPVHLPPSRYSSIHLFSPPNTSLLTYIHTYISSFSYPAVTILHRCHSQQSPHTTFNFNCLLRHHPTSVHNLSTTTQRYRYCTPRITRQNRQCIFLQPQSRATCSHPFSPVFPQHSSLHDHPQPSSLFSRPSCAKEPAT